MKYTTDIILFFSLFIIFLMVNVAADDTIDPVVDFISQTPDDGSSQMFGIVDINVSIQEENLSKINYNWDGMNFSLYDNTLMLMMNFDNQNDLGESYEISDSTVVDLSLYQHNGTTKNGLGNTWTNGKYQGAFDFDGTDDVIDVGSQNMLQITGDITVSCWANYESLSSSNTMISQGTSTDNGASDPYNMLYILHLESNKAVSLFWEYGDGYNVEATSDTIPNIESAEWHLYAAVRDSSSKEVFFYIDGQQIGDAVSYTNNPDDGSQGVFTIGAEYQTWNGIGYYNCFNGLIDKVKVWNRCLSSNEIYQNYVSNLQKFNQTQWYLSVNQSENTTDELTADTYTFQVFAEDINTNQGATEKRSIQVTGPTPPVPESSTVILFSIGNILLLISVIYRRRR